MKYTSLHSTALIAFMMLTSCQNKSEMKTLSWAEGASHQALKEINSINTTDTKTSAFYKDQKIEISQQSFNDVKVEDTFVKKIYTDKKKVIAADAQFVSYGLFQTRKLQTKDVNFEKIIEDLKSNINSNKLRKYDFTPFIKHTESGLQQWLAVKYELNDGTLWQADFDQDKKFIQTRRLGSDFDTTQAHVYLKGPKLSSLTDVLLEQISLSPSVNNASIFVDSEADKKIASITPQLKFDPKDERFDQIQAFYYLDQAQSWMKEHLKVRFPEKLTAVVNVGFPEKTNTAFYFQNKIRLGHGDDENYTMMASDPSIVYHESFHALVDGLAALPFEKEGGSLNEAFADFFTCVALNRPYLGESSYLKGPYKRSVLNAKKLEEKTGGLYGDSLIISGLLWDIKEKLTAEKALDLATETLVQLNPSSEFKDFNMALLKASQKLTAEDKAVVQNSLKQRGFIYE